MMKICVKMTWVEAKDQWHMTLPDGTFLQELYDCNSIKRLFGTLDKEKPPRLYTLEVQDFAPATL